MVGVAPQISDTEATLACRPQQAAAILVQLASESKRRRVMIESF